MLLFSFRNQLDDEVQLVLALFNRRIPCLLFEPAACYANIIEQRLCVFSVHVDCAHCALVFLF